MSNFLIFKAAFNNSATPAIGTYTAEGATALFNMNASLSPDYYLYNTADNTAVQWFVPTTETTDFEFVADILTRDWTNRVTYFIIADSTGTTRLRMWSQYDNWFFENSDSDNSSGTEYIGVINPTTSGGFGVFHQFRVRVRKLTESSSSVEVYVDGTLKLTATAGAALVTCAKIGFVGGVNTFGPGTGAGIKNAYVYDLSGGEVIDRGVLSGAFNRFISWVKSKFALKSDIPTVNDATLTIQQNGTNVQTFTANASANATANIQCVDLTSAQTIGGDKDFTGTTTAHDLVPSATNTYNFGSPTAQWNNAYIKSLTINGVAAGDILTHNVSEFVGVTTAQTIGGQKTFSSSPRVTKAFPDIALNISDCDVTELPTEVKFATLYFRDKNNKNLSYIVSQQRTDGTKRMCLRTHRTDNIDKYYSIDLDSNGDFYPEQNNSLGLGTSAYKWKDVQTVKINNLNPGALSLPSMANISIDTTGFDVTATNIGTFTPTIDGWAILSITQKNKPFGIWILQGSYRVTFQSVYHQGDYLIFALIPVWTNLNLTIYCTADDIDSTRKIDWLRLFPCQGNV